MVRVGKRNCGMCAAYYPTKANQGMCRVHAPEPQVLPSGPKGFTTAIPEVQETWPECMEFCPADEPDKEIPA